MEANAVIQMALLAVLPLIMQGLKKISFIETNKHWLCPLLCIGASIATAYFLKLPQWLMVGIVTGAACNKTYDWTKDIAGSLMLLFALTIIAGAGGCGKVYMSPEYETAVRQAEIVVRELATRCQEGDTEACKSGCVESSKTLTYIVDGLDGKESE